MFKSVKKSNTNSQSADIKMEKNSVKNKNVLDDKTNKILKFTCWILVFVFTTLSLIRVPFVGAFFDSTIFSILFGYTKYFAYFFIYLFLLMCFFPDKKKKIFTWKNTFIVAGIWLSISIIISAIMVLINYNTLQGSSLTFSQYFVGTENSYFDYWRSHDWLNVMSTNLFYANPRGYGGLLSFVIVILFEAVSPIILVIIMMLVIGVIVYFAFKKYNFNTNVKTKTNTSSKNVVFSKWTSIKEQAFSTKKFTDVKEYLNTINENDFKLPIKSLNLINETSEDYYEDLKTEAERTTKKIQSAFTNLKIEFHLLSRKILFKSIIWNYEFKSKKDLKTIKDNFEQFKNSLVINEANVFFENDKLVISEKLDLKPVVSLKEALTNIGANNYYNFVIGKLEDRNLIYINGLLEPNMIVFGSRGSGLSMFISNLTLSLAALNNKDLLDITILDTSSKTLKVLSNLPQVSSYATEQSEIINGLDRIIELIKNRKEIINKYNCKDIYSYYNKTKKTDLKIQLLVLHGLEELMVWNKNEFINKIKFILENSFATGIMVVISCNVVSNETTELNDLFNNIVVFKVDNESDSIDTINIPNAYYLWGNGDGIIKSCDKLYHFQAVFANKQETSIIIDTIKNNSEIMEE